MKTRLRAGRTGTSQYSHYQLKLGCNGIVGTNDCDNERHAGATKTTRLSTNQISEAKKKVIVLELWEKFHSRDQNLLSKENGTSRGSILQKRMVGSEKGCE